MRISYRKFLKLIWEEVPPSFTMHHVHVIAGLMAKIIVQELIKGNTVSFAKLGNFESKFRPARRAYRPDRSEFFMTRATMVPRFKFRTDVKKHILDTCSEKVRLESTILEKSSDS
jgi:nucleoid DNA-binding protein